MRIATDTEKQPTKGPTKSLSAMNPLELGELAGSLAIRSVGEDAMREGLLKTPRRFSKALLELCSGYNITAEKAVGEGIFSAEGSGLVSVKNIEFFSLCEHHMLPFWGNVSVAYYPDKKILGLSKVGRVVEVFARRLQVQERLTKDIATSIQSLLKPRAIAVTVTAAHMCMMMRGVKKTESETKTEFFLKVDSLTTTEQARLWDSLR